MHIGNPSFRTMLALKCSSRSGQCRIPRLSNLSIHHGFSLQVWCHTPTGNHMIDPMKKLSYAICLFMLSTTFSILSSLICSKNSQAVTTLNNNNRTSLLYNLNDSVTSAVNRFLSVNVAHSARPIFLE